MEEAPGPRRSTPSTRMLPRRKRVSLRRLIVAALVSSIAFLPAGRPALGRPAPSPSPGPCAASERRQFDFWIGNWRVVDRSGAFQGTNDVTGEFGGCAIQEHWKGSDGSRGSSFSTYVPSRKEWQQTWVDSHGLTLQLYGGIHDGSMVLSGPRTTRTGTVVDRIVWTPLSQGRVRQNWQEADASEKHWREIFDGYYSRVKAPAS